MARRLKEAGAGLLARPAAEAVAGHFRRLHRTILRSGRTNIWPDTSLFAPAPPVHEGWVTAPPDFVGVGVQKAGTTWWYALITAHPGIADVPHRHKEVHFFDRFWNSPWSADAAADYQRYFPRPGGTVCGEWTPRYLSDWWVPPLLNAAAPDARILVLLRDPVDRYVSGLAHDLSRNAPIHPLMAELAFQRGLYHRQLLRILEFFARDQVLVLQYERCKQDTEGELRRTFEFLGLGGGAPAIDSSRKVNATIVPKPVLDDNLRMSLVRAYASETQRLMGDFPDLDVSLWPSAVT